MPTESTIIPPPNPPSQASSPNASLIKCSLCGAGGLSSAPQRSNDGVVLLHDPIERICGGCVRAQDIRRRMDEAVSDEGEEAAIGLGLRGVRLRESSVEGSDATDGSSSSGEETTRYRPPPINIVPQPAVPRSVTIQAQSLPAESPRPWSAPVPAQPLATPRIDEEAKPVDSLPPQAVAQEKDVLPNRLLDVCRSRIDSAGKGALHPGSVFKGTQTSGRSAYEVEINIVVSGSPSSCRASLISIQDVNLGESSVSGYLTIAHLTDAHPQLTTFFTGEIIGPQYGFITGPRFGATEHDDMRHWGRFEQFRRPATRGDMLRPELFFRDPLPDRNRGETSAKDRDFLFLRIKERFLVPDHKVKDISGASFAGEFGVSAISRDRQRVSAWLT